MSENPYASPRSDDVAERPTDSAELPEEAANRFGTGCCIGFGLLFSVLLLPSLSLPIQVATPGYVFLGFSVAGCTVPHVRRMRKHVRPGAESMPLVCLVLGCYVPGGLAAVVSLKWMLGL
ncbi:MAG: hypothetical protein AAGB00_05670 [Planctomycetota bacterium]